jgi:hypothetical protein
MGITHMNTFELSHVDLSRLIVTDLTTLPQGWSNMCCTDTYLDFKHGTLFEKAINISFGSDHFDVTH